MRNVSQSSKKLRTSTRKLEPTDKDVRSDTPDEVVVEVSPVSSTETQSTIPYSLVDDGKLTAEIRWALKHVFFFFFWGLLFKGVQIFWVRLPQNV